MSTENSSNPSNGYTKEGLKKYLADIERKVIESNGAYMHSLVALNEILRHPDVPGLLDEELKSQMQDLWIKLKSTGIQLGDPPLLFGLPEGFGETDEETASPDEEAEEIAQAERARKKELPATGPDGNLIS